MNFTNKVNGIQTIFSVAVFGIDGSGGNSSSIGSGTDAAHRAPSSWTKAKSAEIHPSDWIRNPDGPPAVEPNIDIDPIPEPTENWPEGLDSDDPVAKFIKHTSPEQRARIHLEFITTENQRKEMRNANARPRPGPELFEIPLGRIPGWVAPTVDVLIELAAYHGWTTDISIYELGLASVKLHRRIPGRPNAHTIFPSLRKWREVDWTYFDFGDSDVETLNFYYYINHNLTFPTKCFYQGMC
jgi:hypothetical protein